MFACFSCFVFIWKSNIKAAKDVERMEKKYIKLLLRVTLTHRPIWLLQELHKKNLWKSKWEKINNGNTALSSKNGICLVSIPETFLRSYFTCTKWDIEMTCSYGVFVMKLYDKTNVFSSKWLYL